MQASWDLLAKIYFSSDSDQYYLTWQLVCFSFPFFIFKFVGENFKSPWVLGIFCVILFQIISDIGICLLLSTMSVNKPVFNLLDGRVLFLWRKSCTVWFVKFCIIFIIQVISKMSVKYLFNKFLCQFVAIIS